MDMTLAELYDVFYEHNRAHNVTHQFDDDNRLFGVIVFKPETWPDKNYTLKERSYRVSSDNKAFIPGMGGNSIYANCLDGVDKGVRLDWYIHDGWIVDYCYLENGDTD